MKYADFTPAERKAKYEEIKAKYEEYRQMGLKLDLSRGKPGAEILNLSDGLLAPIPREDYNPTPTVDYRNYGEPDGIPEMRKLFSEVFGIPYENVVVGGNSSLQLMYDALARAMLFGFVDSPRPWAEEKTRKWICITPGYDRHFAVTETLGFELLSVPMLADGPDMDKVEALVRDPAVKGIWCVPKYSNPTGNTYSDEVVRRLCAMECAAPDFRIFWDNAYAIHDFDENGDTLLDVIPECVKAGHPNRVLYFASTSKITYPGGGVAMMAASEANLSYLRRLMNVQIICYDKLNQLRHVRYLKDKATTVAHMRELGAAIKVKFDVAHEALAPLREAGIVSYTEPKGGYFISLDTLPGCAKRTYELAKAAGVTLTPVGATFPYGIDPEDKNIRLAVTYSSDEQLTLAMKILATAITLAALENT